MEVLIVPNRHSIKITLTFFYGGEKTYYWDKDDGMEFLAEYMKELLEYSSPNHVTINGAF